MDLFSVFSSPHKHIVVIDDDPHIRRIFSDILTKKKYKVSSFASGTELGAYAGLGEVHLFFLDCQLAEGPSGPEIARELRAQGYEGPVCFVTARHETFHEEELAEPDRNFHFIGKPVSPWVLIEKAESLTAPAK